jgi:hypothetical protein
MSKILVNEIGTWTGTEIALVSGRFLTGTASQFKITGGTAGQALITDGSGGLTFGDAGSSFPTQTGQAGKFLTTDGTDASWAAVDALPSQTGQAGEFLQTDGTTATWEPASGGYDVPSTSTGYFDVPAGTTAQRPSTPATGNMRWNTDDEALEHYSGSAGGWVQWAGAAPTITSISPTTAPTTGTSVTVTGINFQAGSIVKLIGNDATVYNAASTSYVSSTEVSFTTPVLPVANEPYDVKLVLPAGGFFVFPDALDAGGTPTWTTAAGSLGEISHAATGTHFTLVAVDPDGVAVTYSADTANTTILTNAGLTLNSDGTITGDPVDVSTTTVYSFDAIATDSGGNTTTRSFSITVANYFAGATGGTITTYNSGGVNYKVHTFLSGATFSAGAVGGKADILVVGGGGGGGGDNGGAGGAGGMIAYTNWTIAGGTNPTDNYTITIGAGGSGTSGYHSNDNAAGSSTVFGVGGSEWNGTTGNMLTAVGGGRGATGDSNGAANGYGGGGSHNYDPTAGYTDPGGTIQCYSGGYSVTDEGGGGGGGASENGEDATTSIGGKGGDGLENNFRTGSNQFYAGGGGGGESQNSSGQQAAGGAGGGGAGWSAATANTGGGGGGGRQASTNGQAGGTGIVVIRYIIS